MLKVPLKNEEHQEKTKTLSTVEVVEEEVSSVFQFLQYHATPGVEVVDEIQSKYLMKTESYHKGKKTHSVYKLEVSHLKRTM